MHNNHYDDLFFATKYVEGLKHDIRIAVEPHIPVTVDRAAVIAKIQQRALERQKHKFSRQSIQRQPAAREVPTNTSNLNRVRQLRDYRKQNHLCYFCGEKFEPGHLDVCTKRNKPQTNALMVNSLDKEEITEEQLNQLKIEEILTDDFCQLSINALTSADTENCIKLRSLVKNKVMLILVDSGSSHSFISSQFVQLANLPI